MLQTSRGRAAWVAAALLASFHAQPATADEASGRLGFRGAQELANRCVLKIAQEPDQGRKVYGSAVVLDVDREGGTLILATCAHVVIGIDTPRVLLNVPQKGEEVVGRVERGRIDGDHDLAILEATWTGEKKWLDLVIKAPPAAPPPVPGEDRLEGLRATRPASPSTGAR